MLTLHDMRWPFAAARASLWLLLFLLCGLDTGVRGIYVQPSYAPHAPRYLTRGDDLLALWH